MAVMIFSISKPAIAEINSAFSAGPEVLIHFNFISSRLLLRFKIFPVAFLSWHDYCHPNNDSR